MFKRDYTFYGKHARYVTELTSVLKGLDKTCIFERNLDVFMYSSIIGIIYGRQGVIDKSPESNEKVEIRKIAGAQMITILTELEYIYELIMLNHGKDKDDIETRVDRAFRYTKNEELKNEGEKIFNSYVLGGVEVLYEKIFKEDTDTDDILVNLYDFVEEFNSKYMDKKEDSEINEIFEFM